MVHTAAAVNQSLEICEDFIQNFTIKPVKNAIVLNTQILNKRNLSIDYSRLDVNFAKIHEKKHKQQIHKLKQKLLKEKELGRLVGTVHFKPVEQIDSEIETLSTQLERGVEPRSHHIQPALLYFAPLEHFVVTPGKAFSNSGSDGNEIKRSIQCYTADEILDILLSKKYYYLPDPATNLVFVQKNSEVCSKNCPSMEEGDMTESRLSSSLNSSLFCLDTATGQQEEANNAEKEGAEEVEEVRGDSGEKIEDRDWFTEYLKSCQKETIEQGGYDYFKSKKVKKEYKKSLKRKKTISQKPKSRDVQSTQDDLEDPREALGTSQGAPFLNKGVNLVKAAKVRKTKSRPPRTSKDQYEDGRTTRKDSNPDSAQMKAIQRRVSPHLAEQIFKGKQSRKKESKLKLLMDRSNGGKPGGACPSLFMRMNKKKVEEEKEIKELTKILGVNHIEIESSISIEELDMSPKEEDNDNRVGEGPLGSGKLQGMGFGGSGGRSNFQDVLTVKTRQRARKYVQSPFRIQKGNSEGVGGLQNHRGMHLQKSPNLRNRSTGFRGASEKFMRRLQPRSVNPEKRRRAPLDTRYKNSLNNVMRVERSHREADFLSETHSHHPFSLNAARRKTFKTHQSQKKGLFSFDKNSLTVSRIERLAMAGHNSHTRDPQEVNKGSKQPFFFKAANSNQPKNRQKSFKLNKNQQNKTPKGSFLLRRRDSIKSHTSTSNKINHQNTQKNFPKKASSRSRRAGSFKRGSKNPKISRKQLPQINRLKNNNTTDYRGTGSGHNYSNSFDAILSHNGSMDSVDSFQLASGTTFRTSYGRRETASKQVAEYGLNKLLNNQSLESSFMLSSSFMTKKDGSTQRVIKPLNLLDMGGYCNFGKPGSFEKAAKRNLRALAAGKEVEGAGDEESEFLLKKLQNRLEDLRQQGSSFRSQSKRSIDFGGYEKPDFGMNKSSWNSISDVGNGGIGAEIGVRGQNFHPIQTVGGVGGRVKIPKPQYGSDRRIERRGKGGVKHSRFSRIVC